MSDYGRREKRKSPEPYLLFHITCEGLGKFRLKMCLKCAKDWTSENTGLNIMLPERYINKHVKWDDGWKEIDVDVKCKKCWDEEDDG